MLDKKQEGYAIGGLLLVLAILILAGGGAYFVLNKNAPATQEAPTSSTSVPPPPTLSPPTKPVSPNPKPPPEDNRVPITTEKKCVVTGCSGEICADDRGLVSICIYKPEFACYTSARCTVQANGTCGWTQTPELKACLAKSQTLLPLSNPKTPTPTPVPQQTTPTPIPQTTIPIPKSFTLEADDAGFYPSSTLTVVKGTPVTITFNVRTDTVYYGGLDFRSDHFPTAAALPGQSATVQFTADKSFVITSYWPSSGVRKADLFVEVK